MTDQNNTIKPLRLSPIKVIVYSLLPAIVLFGGIEGCARLIELWRPPLTLDHGWGFNEESLVFEPLGVFGDWMGTRTEKMVSFHKQRFQMPKPSDTFRIAVLGGSNVHYMQYNLIYMLRRLNQLPDTPLHFEVVNFGGLAYGSHRLRIMTPEMLAYEPDLVFIYAGHNEFEEAVHQQLVDVESIPIQKAAYSLASLRLLRDGIAAAQFHLINQQRLRANLPPEVNWVGLDEYIFSDEELEERMRLFRENMDAIISQCLERGAPVMVSTVASNYWSPGLNENQVDIRAELQRLYAAGRYQEGLNLARDTVRKGSRRQTSDVENGIIRELATRFELIFIDGEQLIIEREPNGVPGETLMNDRCHLNIPGRDIIVGELEREVKRMAGIATAG